VRKQEEQFFKFVLKKCIHCENTIAGESPDCPLEFFHFPYWEVLEFVMEPLNK